MGSLHLKVRHSPASGSAISDQSSAFGPRSVKDPAHHRAAQSRARDRARRVFLHCRTEPCAPSCSSCFAGLRQSALPGSRLTIRSANCSDPDSQDYKTYQEVTRRFPSNEFDVLIVVEGNKLLERDSLQKLREIATDLQLLDGTRGLISIFSAREPPPPGGGVPPPLFPSPLPQGAEYQALIQKVAANEIIRGKLLSEDQKLTLMVLALDPAAVAGRGASGRHRRGCAKR